jgi:hypothetical protein
MEHGYFLQKLINFFISIVEIILGLRIFFQLFNANPTASFVEWIYKTSDILMLPFRGIFPTSQIERGIVLDVSAIFAAIMYMILGYLLLYLISLLALPATKRGVRVEK